MFTKNYIVYGLDGHRQRESFFPSSFHDFSREGKTRIITVFNRDETGTNDFTILRIVRDTEMECDTEFYGQLFDGVFENSNVGEFKEITDEELLKILMNKGKKEMKDIRSEVYNALAGIMFETEASKEDMDRALEWFTLRFYVVYELDDEGN